MNHIYHNYNKGNLIIAVDIGTTSVKVLAIHADKLLLHNNDADLVRAKTEEGYPLNEPKPGWFEQDPEVVVQAVMRSVRHLIEYNGIVSEDIKAISFSSAMHGLIVVDEEGAPLTSCMTWADLRAASYAKKLRENGQAEEIARRTGVPIHAMTPLCKLLWLREHDPVLFSKAHAFIGIKEFVLHRWFGAPYVMDESVAGGTGLYQLESRQWDGKALELVGVEPSRLPQLVPSTHVLRGMLPEAAAAMGLTLDVPVIVGAADGVLANLGAGAVESGIGAVTVGTSGAVRIAQDQPTGDAQGRLFCYALAEGLWIAGGPVNSGGVVLRWVRDKLFPVDAGDASKGSEATYEKLVSQAMEIPAGSDGLLALPHLAGERAPHWDEDARGVFFGLSLHHDRRHMIRASLEGIIFGLRSVAEAIAARSSRSDGLAPLREIRASGGFFRSSELRQLMADIFGCPVMLMETEDASAIGAAMLAVHALGEAPSLNQLAASIRITDRRQPNPEAVRVYNRLYPIYSSLYTALAPAFAEIAAFQRDEA
ncbi:gluconate kinase [Paenibacillus baekrokdamisoli]|uniref:Gluconate kinase n=1 Tax=Paenibacillus baekrokdamisoli TaxID=1712516 RepID=A0A3G9IMS1_9BACL|nr:gluconokinase [Paenibacillus baekrokdamisoli]MBB3067212.1 gluconokinase [Paenibacillus baekrokdamisoli]BBH19596.1 gluconate kinase [Paenibacillus baekrokdamisoli]